MDPQRQAEYLLAARRAVACFPIPVRDFEQVSVTLVNESENMTFQVVDDTGQRFVLRLHRPGYHTLAELESEQTWVRALAAAGIAVPHTLQARSGSAYTTVRVGETDEHRHAGLAHWVTGEMLAGLIEARASWLEDSRLVTHRFGQLGALIADMHNQAATWQPPPAFVRHALDGDGLLGEQPFWGRFWEHPGLLPADAALLARARRQLYAQLGQLDQSPSTYSLIHADLHSGNVLVGSDTLSVIDFDDAGFGWHAYDLAVALSHYRTTAALPRITAALLDGYQTRRSLSAAVTEQIPLFLLIRRLAIIGWLMHRPELGRELEQDTIDALCEDLRRLGVS